MDTKERIMKIPKISTEIKDESVAHNMGRFIESETDIKIDINFIDVKKVDWWEKRVFFEFDGELSWAYEEKTKGYMPHSNENFKRIIKQCRPKDPEDAGLDRRISAIKKYRVEFWEEGVSKIAHVKTIEEAKTILKDVDFSQILSELTGDVNKKHVTDWLKNNADAVTEYLADYIKKPD
jgi:hypothetical protein